MIDDFDRAWLEFVHPEECWGGASSGVCRVVNRPSDPGGRTLHGLAERYNPDVWKDGPPDVIRAGEVMRARYWIPAQCDKFAWPLNLVVFDWCVHAGEDNPAEALQKLVGARVDGDIGPKTVAAVHAWAARTAARELVRARSAELAASPRAHLNPGWFLRINRLAKLVG